MEQSSTTGSRRWHGRFAIHLKEGVLDVAVDNDGVSITMPDESYHKYAMEVIEKLRDIQFGVISK